MGIFGWSLPPGCSMRDIDPPEQPCEVCGEYPDNCICPECPICYDYGNPRCYLEHGLRRTEEQKFHKEVQRRFWHEEFLAQKEWEDKYAKEFFGEEEP